MLRFINISSSVQGGVVLTRNMDRWTDRMIPNYPQKSLFAGTKYSVALIKLKYIHTQNLCPLSTNDLFHADRLECIQVHQFGCF